MVETRIKMCGITTVEDAILCDENGADYIGLIFAESPRRVGTGVAASIRTALPGAVLVGVFRDDDPERIAETAAVAGLDMIQLHGSESGEECRKLCAATRLPLIKAFCYGEIREAGELARFDAVEYFLLDLDKGSPLVEETPGVLWNEADGLGRAGYRIFLAGNLDPGNVAHAVALASPFCVDVCRGVEKSPGVKDILKVKQFSMEVRGCTPTER